jgi:hypothetical protein
MGRPAMRLPAFWDNQGDERFPKIPASAVPKVGFVSLGCPKALTDSELILTQLSAEGYQHVQDLRGRRPGDRQHLRLHRRRRQGEPGHHRRGAGRQRPVIVTGCLGARTGEAGGNLVRQMHPSVLAVTGPHATQEVMDAVHAHLPKPHDPFVDLVPAAGIKLTPRHYAYLKISEGCNHRCTFCIIPSMRGDLVSRPIGDVLKEARALFEGGVKELLVVSQDTSAYGVDTKYRTGFFDGRPVKTRMLELVQALGELPEPHGAWVRLHYVYPYPHVDEIIPLMASGKRAALPGRAVPAQPPGRAAAHEAAGQRRAQPRAHPGAGAPPAPSWWCAAPSSPVSPARPKSRVPAPAGLRARSADRPRRLLRLQPGGGRRGQRHAGHAAAGSARGAPGALHGRGRGSVGRRLQPARGRDHAGAGGFRRRPGPQGRRGPQLCRCARDRRHGAAAAARKDQQALRGG